MQTIMGLSWWKIQQIRTPDQVNRSLKGTGGSGNMPLLAYTPTNGTNMLPKSTRNTMESATQEISEQSTIFPTTTSSVVASPVRHLALLEKEGDLTTQEEHYSLISQGFSRKSNQDSVYWKTSKDCYLMTTEELSKPSSPRLLSWGTISNGKCLTQRISVSPRIGKECSLSDILEEHPDQKYFLLKFIKRNQKNIAGNYSFTVDGANTGGIRQDMKIRRLTPVECERLQGFPDGWTEGISDTQRYKCLGNAVTTNVVQWIGEQLVKESPD